ncbi:MAG: hypothetical protein Q7J22_00350 [Candidatus Wolfebacteria bacterium]|nr:hypothetical protein [Candidatus Wolfebacteria bacterium]
MKKLFTISFLLIILLLISTAGAQTLSSLSISPTAINATKGQAFTILVNLTPAGKNYTTKVGLDYPANLVRLNSFTFANGWMPLAQPGYDLIDNTSGKMLKTGGFPGGVATLQLFGTASFTALQSGSGSVKANVDSFSLDSENKNTLSAALPSVSLKVSAPATAPTPTPTPTEEPEATTPEITEEQPAEEPATTTTAELIPIPVGTTPGPEARASLLSSLGNVLSIGTSNIWIGIFISLVFLALIAQLIYKATRKPKEKKK